MNEKRIYLPSLFKGMYTNECRTAEWGEIANVISSGMLADDTMKYRYFTEHGLDKDAQAIKKRMMAFTPAMECDGGRKAENFVGLTGVGMCDFDHVSDMDAAFAKAKADSHAMLVYRTISGQGIRVLFRYTASDNCYAGDNRLYSQAFAAGNEYFAKLLGEAADGQCKNVGRLSVLCHDAEAMLNETCEVFVISECNAATKAGKSKLCGRKPSIGKAATVVEERIKSDGIEYAKGSYNSYVSRAGYYLNMLGVSKQDATGWAVARFCDYDAKDVRSIMESCYNHTDEFGTLKITAIGGGAKSKGEKRERGFASIGDIEDFLTGCVELRFNEITRKTEYNMQNDDSDTENDGKRKWLEMNDRTENSLWARMCKSGQTVKISDVHAVIHSEFVPLWNPFMDYFNNLPEWDGKTDYIGETAAMVHVMPGEGDADGKAAQEMFAGCFKKWLVATVVSLMEEDVVNNVIMVLIGKQGIFKTTFFYNLLPPVLSRYFFVKTNADRMTKDDKLSLAEFAIICMEEIDSMRTPELNQLKALVTTKHINERAAYDRYKENRAHIASFCGTGNKTQFLTDQTGNRRWLPFEVSGIDNPMYHNYNYDGMYSQAKALWKSGMHYWFEKSETDALASHITHFEVPNIEEELIATYYRVPEEGEPYIMVSATNIIEHINIFIKRALSTVKVGLAMKKMGFTQKRTATGRMFLVVLLKPVDRNDQRKVDSCVAQDLDLPF